MAIQVRRGNESDFDASKMLPGEWAVSLDTRYVRMCFAPGIVLRMSTYDAFEADMAQVQTILAECRSIQSAVQRIQTEVNTKASLTVEYANDAKESADRAYSEAERAKTYADNAEAVTGVQIATKERAGLIKGGNNHIAEDGTLMLITETTSTTQPNSHAGRENILEIGGVTEQDSTAGKNLAKSTFIGATNLDIYNSPLFVDADFKPNTQYTFSFKGTVGNRYYVNENMFVEDITFTVADGITTFTATTKGEFSSQLMSGGYIILKNHKNQTSQNKFEEFMLVEGSTALPYEQYSGGIPAPNPSYPMEIKKSVVSGVKTHGKNFFKPTLQNTESNGLTCTDNGDGTYKLNGTSNAGGFARFDFGTIHIKGTYKFVGCPNDGSFTTFGLNLLENNDFGGARYATYNKEGIVITENKLFGVCIIVEGNTTCNNLIFKPMITTDLEATYDDFEPYQGTEITFSQPIELYGIGDVMDYIDVERGKVVRKFAEYDLSTLTQYYSSNRNGWYALLNELKPLAKCLFEKYKYSETSWYSDNYAGVDQDKTFWCKNNDSTNKATGCMIAELATPTTEALPIADQIGLNSYLCRVYL